MRNVFRHVITGLVCKRSDGGDISAFVFQADLAGDRIFRWRVLEEKLRIECELVKFCLGTEG